MKSRFLNAFVLYKGVFLTLFMPGFWDRLMTALYQGRVKSTRPSYLENGLTFENQTWYTIKRITLEYFDTIFKIIFSPLQRNHYGGYRQTKKSPVQNGRYIYNFHFSLNFFNQACYINNN